ncbi:MAG TPA: response regulator [Chloroflexi bacterium]|nr:response regulator [Chloroflexota bacterium]
MVTKQRSVLIASNHPLFAQGLQHLFRARSGVEVSVVGVARTLEDARRAIERLKPDLVVVDYDDDQVNREEFLNQFFQGEEQRRLVLLSLQEGGDRGVVYDRRNITLSRVATWLDSWFETDDAGAG